MFSIYDKIYIRYKIIVCPSSGKGGFFPFIHKIQNDKIRQIKSGYCHFYFGFSEGFTSREALTKQKTLGIYLQSVNEFPQNQTL